MTTPQPGIVCGIGTVAAPTAVYIVRAGAVARLDVSKLTSTRGDRRRWHAAAGYGQLPDPRHAADPAKYPTPTFDADNAQSAQSVGIVFDTPGDYPVTVDVARGDGSAVTYGQAVRVVPDTRPVFYFGPGGVDTNAGTAAAPMLTLAKMNAVVAKGGVRVVVLGDLPDAVRIGGGIGNVCPGANTTIEGQPKADGTLPKLYTAACPLFGVGGVADVSIRNLEITARGPDTAGVGIMSWGDGLLVDNCRFGTLVMAVDIFGGDGWVVQRCVQVAPTGIKKQVGGVWGGVRFNLFASVLTQSDEEATWRLDKVGAGTASGIEWNLLAQTHPEVCQKSPLDVRTAHGLVVSHNAFIGGGVDPTSPWSANGDESPTCADILITGNVYRRPVPVAVTEAIAIKGYSNHITVDGEDCQGPAGTVDVSVTTMAAVRDVVIKNNQVSGGMHLAAVPVATPVTPAIPTPTPTPTPTATPPIPPVPPAAPTPAATPAPLAGTPFGTAGSYQNAGDTIAKVFDGDLTTAFDGPTGNGNAVGIDLGAVKVITSIQYAPRPNWNNRMVGGRFEASSDATFANNVMPLATITAAPPYGKLTAVVLAAPVSARYVRYVSPVASFGNIAAMVIVGC